MYLKNTATSYGSVAKFFHWLIFFLVVIMLLVGFFMLDIPDKALRGQVVNLHKLTGLTILGLMILRSLWAMFNRKPLLPAWMPLWQRFAAHTMHLCLYVVLIVMPLLGWVGSVAGGYAPHIGAAKLELPLAQDKALSEVAFNWHNIVAVIIIILVCLHILASLYHHFIKKDDVLRRMMPHSRT